MSGVSFGGGLASERALDATAAAPKGRRRSGSCWLPDQIRDLSQRRPVITATPDTPMAAMGSAGEWTGAVLELGTAFSCACFWIGQGGGDCKWTAIRYDFGGSSRWDGLGMGPLAKW